MENDLISRQAAIELIERMKPYHQEADDIAEMIANMPSAQPEVIRCKDCKYYDPNDHCYLQGAEANDFCSYAERRADESD